MTNIKLDHDSLASVINEVKDVLVIDLLQYALDVDNKYLQELKEPDPGLYLVNSHIPLIRLTVADYYYPKSKIGQDKYRLTSFKSIIDCDEDIVDIDSEIVLSLEKKIRYKKYILDKPSIPVAGIELAHVAADNYLSSICSYTNKRYVTKSIDKLLKNKDGDSLLNDDNLETIFRKLRSKISIFVGNDTWNIYFIKIKETTLVIEKSIDFRIYDWYRIMLEKQEKEY